MSDVFQSDVFVRKASRFLCNISVHRESLRAERVEPVDVLCKHDRSLLRGRGMYLRAELS